MTPTRSGLPTERLVAEVHRAQARARDGAGGDAGFEEIAARDADGVLKVCLGRRPFLQDSDTSVLPFVAADEPTSKLVHKEIEPAPAADLRGGQREQGEHFDTLIERRHARRLTQNGCIITTDNRNTAPATQASRVNSPTSSSRPIARIP